jgi:hypothetical protein
MKKSQNKEIGKERELIRKKHLFCKPVKRNIKLNKSMPYLKNIEHEICMKGADRAKVEYVVVFCCALI